MSAGATCIAYETVTSSTGNLPLLAPMSEIAGRLAPQVGAQCLEKIAGGRGILLGGVPGVPPAEVIILGGAEEELRDVLTYWFMSLPVRTVVAPRPPVFCSAQKITPSLWFSATVPGSGRTVLSAHSPAGRSRFFGCPLGTGAVLNHFLKLNLTCQF